MLLARALLGAVVCSRSPPLACAIARWSPRKLARRWQPISCCCCSPPMSPCGAPACAERVAFSAKGVELSAQAGAQGAHPLGAAQDAHGAWIVRRSVPGPHLCASARCHSLSVHVGSLFNLVSRHRAGTWLRYLLAPGTAAEVCRCRSPCGCRSSLSSVQSSATLR